MPARERLRQNDLPGAIDKFREAVSLDPHNAQAHYQLGARAAPQGRAGRGARRVSESAGPCAVPEGAEGLIRPAEHAAQRISSRLITPASDAKIRRCRAIVPVRRFRVDALVLLAIACSLASTGRLADVSAPAPGFSFTNIARAAGLDARIVFGGDATNKYLLETTGTGVALIDYDNDGRLDLFFVNGSTLEGFPADRAPTNHLYRNTGTGSFEDVTQKAGLAASGWGQGACVGDYDNDGSDDLFVTYWGQNHLYHNTGQGRFVDVTQEAGLSQSRVRWNTGCAFLDYDRDGRLDLIVANYIDLDLKTAPTPESGLCRYKGLQVACGPPGLTGGQQRAVPQPRRRPIRGRVGDVGDHACERHLRPRRQHARLRQRRLGRRLRRQRFQSKRAVPKQSRRHVHRHWRAGRLRLQPGREAAGGDGRCDRRLRPQRHDGHLQDELRGRYVHPLRELRRRIVRGPDVRRRDRARTRGGSGGARRSSTSTTTAGSTCSSRTGTSIRRCGS